MIREVEIVVFVINQYSITACIFRAVLLDLSAGITDSFERRGAYLGIYGILDFLWIISAKNIPNSLQKADGYVCGSVRAEA